MAGASVLAARACMRSGVGLLTVHSPLCNNLILQTSIPEAIVHHDEHEHHYATSLDSQKYTAVAIGPGIGQHEDTERALYEQLELSLSPIILDADALNILGNHKTWLPLIPKHSILTPHPKELERLIGHCSNSYERLTRTQELAERMCINIILKGAWTAVITSKGVCYFNPTGNPGMATAGSGDVLTGVLLALMAQGYSPENAALIGTYIHGASGDLAAEEKGENGMIASDIIENLPLTWSQLKKNSYLCSNKELKCY
jgi:NAD(P)H-hydrate epimerase